MKRLISFLLVVFAVTACQNFEYTHPLCTTDLRVDIPGLEGNYFQTGQSLTILGSPPIEGANDITYYNFSIERKGVGSYVIREEGKSDEKPFTCQVGKKIIAEGIDARQVLKNNTRMPRRVFKGIGSNKSEEPTKLR